MPAGTAYVEKVLGMGSGDGERWELVYPLVYVRSIETGQHEAELG